ncbi:MAG: hypothetical protein M1549_01160 [Candidatus Dependentiae bacterium]|nr:hypothetical protein [Candidatus Dependentiae bacterium]
MGKNKKENRLCTGKPSIALDNNYKIAKNGGLTTKIDYEAWYMPRKCIEGHGQ